MRGNFLRINWISTHRKSFLCWKIIMNWGWWWYFSSTTIGINSEVIEPLFDQTFQGTAHLAYYPAQLPTAILVENTETNVIQNRQSAHAHHLHQRSTNTHTPYPWHCSPCWNPIYLSDGKPHIFLPWGAAGMTLASISIPYALAPLFILPEVTRNLGQQQQKSKIHEWVWNPAYN